MIAAHRLADRVELVGRCTHATLPAYYAAADVVVVPSVVDSAGDRDGLPNVVLESMASQRPVVASAVAAIPAAVRDGVTGTLVPPGDPAALAGALAALIDSPARRVELGRAARLRAETEFGLSHRTEEFCQVLERAYA
jgi:glycosyltransferase involved in cell wall biosynthesis